MTWALLLSLLSLSIWTTTEAQNNSEVLDKEDVSSESRNQIGIIAANSFRKIHGVPPLEYDAQLAEHAAGWAEKVLNKIMNEQKLKPYYSHPYVEGENVMVVEGPVEPLSLGTAVSEWYSEIKKYDFNKNKFLRGTAQFTQLIWKETSKIGLGSAYNPEKNWLVVVAQFKPVGNTGYHNSFGLNVFPPNASHSEIKSASVETPKKPTGEVGAKEPPVTLPATSMATSTSLEISTRPSTTFKVHSTTKRTFSNVPSSPSFITNRVTRHPHHSDNPADKTLTFQISEPTVPPRNSPEPSGQNSFQPDATTPLPFQTMSPLPLTSSESTTFNA